MKKILPLLAVCGLLAATGCAAARGTPAAEPAQTPFVAEEAETAFVNTAVALSREEIAAGMFEKYQPAPGSAAAFMTEDGFWYAVYPKVCLASYEEAAESYPENVIPREIGDFTFAGYYPYDTGFSATDTYIFSTISSAEAAPLAGEKEGLIPLPASCGQALYGVNYRTEAGKLLILTVDKAQVLADDDRLTAQEWDGAVLYSRPNQPYSLGMQTESGPAIWLHTLFPETGVAYNASDPRAELSQEELRALLIEVSRQFAPA